MAWLILARLLLFVGVTYTASSLQPLPWGVAANAAFGAVLAAAAIALEWRLRDVSLPHLLGAPARGGVWNPAPALVQIELQCIDWSRELVGYPPGSQGLLTTGGSLSNFIAIATARRNRLPENFLDGTLYASVDAHHCVAKAAILAGFPERNLRLVPVDGRRRLRVDALAAAVRADRDRSLRPFLVVSSAGTTNTGAIDPTPEIADFCTAHDLWLHVDAAYGGFFRLVPGGTTLLPGLDRADSLALDPHKGLFLPYGTGCLLVRDASALRRAHQSSADYMQDLQLPDGAVSFADISPHELRLVFRRYFRDRNGSSDPIRKPGAATGQGQFWRQPRASIPAALGKGAE